MRRLVVTVALVVLVSCGDQPQSVAPVTSTASDVSSTAVVPGDASTSIPAPSTTQPHRDSIESDLGLVSFVLPADVAPDPLPMRPPVDFVVGYGKWFVDCCYLKIALQNIDPPIPDQERIGDLDTGDMTWTLYDTGPRNGTSITAKATKEPITVLVTAQVRFPDKAPPGSAQRVVEQVARSLVVTGTPSE